MAGHQQLHSRKKHPNMDHEAERWLILKSGNTVIGFVQSMFD
jgi:hypothetical protein